MSILMTSGIGVSCLSFLMVNDEQRRVKAHQ